VPDSFSNAPLIHAACKATLRDPIALNLSNASAIWKMMPEYDDFGDPPGLELPPGRPGPAILGTVQGIALAERQRSLFLTIQSDLIMSWWAKKRGEEGTKYPRFGALADRLWLAIDRVSSATEGGIDLHAVQIAYTDLLIDPAPAYSVLERYFAEKTHMGILRDSDRVNALEAQWSKSAMDFRFSLRPTPIQIQGETAINAYTVEWVAGKMLLGGEDPRLALEEIHVAVLDLFVSVLTEDAKREWEYSADLP
jgi:hypothetical protein